jgi:hypothetical protein
MSELTQQPTVGGLYWLASYPKSGNTWLRVFLDNLRSGSGQPADINDIRTGDLASRRGWLDEVLGFDTADLTQDEIDRLRPEVYRWSGKSRAKIGYRKIHDAYTMSASGEPLIPHEGTLGAVYVVRNPLDVAPSYAHHEDCSMGDLGFCMARTYGHSQVRQRVLSWSAHVASWVDAPGLQVEVVRYEDMWSYPEQTFTRVAEFLGLPSDPVRVGRAIAFSQFSELRQQEEESGFAERSRHTTRFFRRGEAGGWRDTLAPEQMKQIITDHRAMMRRFGYLDTNDNPVECPQ